MKKILRFSLLILVSLSVLATAGFFTWALNPLAPSADTLDALNNTSLVSVEQQRDWIVFRPANQSITTGFIFYPGGHVDFRAYVRHMSDLAERGVLVVLVRMPLSLAVFSADKAEEVMAAYPEVEQWAIGGHSLGGAMAAAFAYQNPETVRGLALWASYPAANNSLADRQLPVVSIYGTLESLAEPERLAESRALLPADAVWVPIAGGNHAQFGDYGPQPGDPPAQIALDDQRRMIVEATWQWLASIQ